MILYKKAHVQVSIYVEFTNISCFGCQNTYNIAMDFQKIINNWLEKISTYKNVVLNAKISPNSYFHGTLKIPEV